MSQGLDLSQPIAEMTATPPNMPAKRPGSGGQAASTSTTASGSGPRTTHPGAWDAPKLALAPRVGAAYKIDDKTVLRGGYARYVIPTELTLSQAPVSGFETVSFLEPPFFGVRGYQNTQSMLQGVPQQTISKPVPGQQPVADHQREGPMDRMWAAAALRCSGTRRTSRRPTTTVSTSTSSARMPGQIMVSATYFLNVGQPALHEGAQQHGSAHPGVAAERGHNQRG